VVRKDCILAEFAMVGDWKSLCMCWSLVTHDLFVAVVIVACMFVCALGGALMRIETDLEVWFDTRACFWID